MRDRARPAAIRWFRWAAHPPRLGMASLRTLEQRGWRRVREHPRYPGSWLCVKAAR
jgi:hypothetical protein